MEHSPRYRSIGETLAAVGLGLTFLLNIFAVIWGAATLSASVGALQSTTTRLDVTIQSVGNSLQDLRERVRVIEDWRTRDSRPPQPMP